MEQKTLINKLLQKDNYLLVILDACRFDVVDFLFDGVVKCRSAGLNTQTWLKRTWPDYYNLTYFAATPRLGHKRIKGYLGTDHFEQVVRVWDVGWDSESGTVPPKSLVEVYKAEKPAKAVVHFMQPHVPYIATDDIDCKRSGNNKVGEVAQEYGDERLALAYYQNLRYVWKHGVEKIKDLSENVVVTSDHGEQLGEDGNYGHNAPDCAILRDVPWYEIGS